MKTRIAGIPCRVVHTGWDDDIPLFQVCDLNERPAPWLERKLNDADIRRIEYELAVELIADAKDAAGF